MKNARISPASTDKARKAGIAEIQARLNAVEPSDANGAAVAGDVGPSGVPSGEGEVVAKAGSPAPRRPTSGGKGKKAKAAKGAKAKTYPVTRGDGKVVQVTVPDDEHDTPKKGAKAKTPKAAKPKTPKKLSCIDAAAKVLAEAKKPLRATEMIEAMGKKGLWSSPKGKTPEASLYSALIREIRDKGADARFTKVARGEFAAAKN